MLDCRCYGQHSHKNKSRAEIRREPFIRAVFVLDYTCSYKWYSLRLIFPCINGLSVWIHVHCMWLAKSINRRAKDMAVRGESSPLSGIICAPLNSVSQGNFTLILSGKKSGISETSGCAWQPCPGGLNFSKLTSKHHKNLVPSNTKMGAKQLIVKRSYVATREQHTKYWWLFSLLFK